MTTKPKPRPKRIKTEALVYRAAPIRTPIPLRTEAEARAFLSADKADALQATVLALRDELRAAIARKPNSALKDLTIAVSKLADEFAGNTQALEDLAAQVRANTEVVRRFLPPTLTGALKPMSAAEIDRMFREGLQRVAAEEARLGPREG
jgi:hypothetical protein